MGSQAPTDAIGDADRSCPFCGNGMIGNAALCVNCGKFSKPSATGKSSATGLIDRINEAIATWEAASPHRRPRRLVVSIPAAMNVRLIAGVLIFVLAIPVPLIGWARGQGFQTPWNTLGMLLVGSALLFWPRLRRHDARDADPIAVSQPCSPAITAWGYQNNLAAIQLMMLATVVGAAAQAHIDEAWWASLGCISLTIPLFRTRVRVLSLGLGAAALIYALYLVSVWDLSYDMTANQYAREHYYTMLGDIYLDIPFHQIAWIAMVIAAVPQLQALRLGSFGIGQLRGDFHVRYFGTAVPIALASAALLAAAYETMWILLYTPAALPVMLGLT